MSVQASAQEFPELSGPVIDAADILSPGTENALALRLHDWESESSDQIVVVTVPDLQGYEIEDYGYRLGRHWGVGVADGVDGSSLDNGAILIIAPNDRRVRIEVGYGLEGTLTDAEASNIIQDITPALRAGDFDAAADAALVAMISVLSGQLDEAQDRRRRAPDRPMAEAAGEGGLPWPLILFAVFFVASIWPRRRKGQILFDSESGTGDVARAIILSQMGQRSGGHLSRGGFSSGGFSGGFSGGGGSFGGGGASGSW